MVVICADRVANPLLPFLLKQIRELEICRKRDLNVLLSAAGWQG